MAPRLPVRSVADRFARWVAESPDERLESAMKGWRRPFILRGVRAGMESELRADPGLDAVIDYKVGGRGDGGQDHFQVVIADGRAKALPTPKRDPNLTVEAEAVPF